MCANLLRKSSRGFRDTFAINHITSAKPVSSIHFFNPREVSLLGHKQSSLSSYPNHVSSIRPRFVYLCANTPDKDRL